MAACPASIIAQNEDLSIVLIDIPMSIVEAQSKGEDNSNVLLYSCPAISQPYADTEPKSVNAKKKLTHQAEDAQMHAETVQLIRNSLEWLHDAMGDEREYCHPRLTLPSLSPMAREKVADTVFEADLESKNQLLNTLASTPNRFQILEDSDNNLRLCDANEQPSYSSSVNMYMPHEQFPGSWYNETNEKGYIEYTSPSSSAKSSKLKFCIPPKCGFLLGNCQDVVKYRSTIRSFGFSVKGRFDFILMDPPWPNRSARRKSAYGIQYDLKSTKSMLLSMDLDAIILPGGFVAVWVTNRPACRDLVLGSNGLFERWNVTLEEEWMWLKVTSTGKPVTPIHGLWRKPIETLLVGKAPSDRMTVARESESVRKRIIVAVPDLHSRKPCLKELFERLLIQRRGSYNALEIFARHLVSGWFSWGKEVLKYNWEGYWAQNPVVANIASYKDCIPSTSAHVS